MRGDVIRHAREARAIVHLVIVQFKIQRIIQLHFVSSDVIRHAREAKAVTHCRTSAQTRGELKTQRGTLERQNRSYSKQLRHTMSQHTLRHKPTQRDIKQQAHEIVFINLPTMRSERDPHQLKEHATTNSQSSKYRRAEDELHERIQEQVHSYPNRCWHHANAKSVARILQPG